MKITLYPYNSIHTFFLIFFVILISSCSVSRQVIILSCSVNNDLYEVLKENNISCVRYNTAEEAIENAKNGSAVMILADNYPFKTTEMNTGLYEKANEKKLRLYIEFPSSIPGYETEEIKKTHWERAVVASDAFAPKLEKNRILAIHDCHFLDIPLEKTDIVAARVAGFDNAVFGLPENVHPLLGEISQGDNENAILVSTTKLSQFITGRYAPTDAWQTIWKGILEWLQPDKKIPNLAWTAIVRPSFDLSEKLPENIENTALKRGIDWYYNSKLILDSKAEHHYNKSDFPMGERTGEMPDTIGLGDGSFGVLEGFMSKIFFDGNQPIRWWRRNDCNAETAGTLSLAGLVFQNSDYTKTGENIGKWLFSSIMSQGDRANPTNPAYGLIGWNDVPKYHENLDGYDVYYGDDNARTLLGMILAGAALKTDQFDQRILQGLLANLRLSGKKGFVPDRVDHPALMVNGWEHYHNSESVSYSGNFQAYLWACYLWAYQQTGFKLFLERAKIGINTMMEGYPNKWGVTGIQMDRARMLLPLSWLIRIEDTPEHRFWLKSLLMDMEQDPVIGTFTEKIEAEKNNFGAGHYQLPKTNEEYGATESPIIQTDGDPCSDLLYAVNFAFIGLREAAETTGDQLYVDAENKLAEFLCKVQIQSEKHPELDGGWFRAFDHNRWEYWASSGDAGWGAWSIEGGWSQSWITITLALRQLKTSFWDFTKESQIGGNFDHIITDFFKE